MYVAPLLKTNNLNVLEEQNLEHFCENYIPEGLRLKDSLGILMLFYNIIFWCFIIVF